MLSSWNLLEVFDTQKNVKAKTENEKFNNVEELDTLQKINCEILIPKSDSQYRPSQVFCKHLTTMTHHAKKENQQVTTGDGVTNS